MSKLVYIGNELSYTNPELAEEWDYDKNFPLTPDDVTYGSDRKVWWICKKCGNNWEAIISSRKAGRGCPICSKKEGLKKRNEAYVKKNNFEKNHPELAKQWHPTKNGDLLPSMVSSSSNKKVWWLCPICGNEWQSAPHTRTSGCGCAVCAGRKVKVGFNDLATVNPELAKQWDYEKNGDLTPQMVTRGCNKKVWWLCEECGNSWQSIIHNRLNGEGCPVCGVKKAHKTRRIQAAKQNNLVDNYPEIASEWNYDKNEEPPENYACKSNKKVWWKCKTCSHEWQATISDRTSRNYGCPKCSMKGSSFPEQALFYYFSKAFKDVENRYVIKRYEFDVYIPSIKTAIEYDGVYYHNNKRSFERDNKKDAFCKVNDIRLIRIRDARLLKTDSAEIITCKDYDLKELQEAIKKLFKELNVENVTVNLEKDRQRILALYNKTVLENSLAVLNPEIAKEWNYERNYPLTPNRVSCYSNHIVWWKCEKGHEWQAGVNNRTRGNRGCPYCSNKKLLEGYNDLATTNPELTKEWDYTKNKLKPNEVIAGNNNLFWWVCSICGYEWQARLNNRSRGTGCPVCRIKQSRINNRIGRAKKNNLAEKYPKIASEWDYEKNEEPPENYSCGSNKRAWWICHYCGKSYNTRIGHRTLNGDKMGCVSCRRKQRNIKT